MLEYGIVCIILATVLTVGAIAVEVIKFIAKIFIKNK